MRISVYPALSSGLTGAANYAQRPQLSEEFFSKTLDGVVHFPVEALRKDESLYLPDNQAKANMSSSSAIDNRFQEVVEKCNFCGSPERKVLHHFPAGFYSHKNYTTYPWDGRQDVTLTIVKCTQCDMIYQSPRFKGEHLGMLYADSVESKLDLEKAVRTHKFGPLLKLISDHCRHQGNGHPTSLDIGTRYGLLPEVLRRQGYDAHGIEFNQLCVDTAKRSGFANVYRGTIDDLHEVLGAAGIQRVNLVTMTDVIEHLLDPMGDLTKLASVQGPGDYMVVQTCDVSSPGYKLFGKWWYHFHGQHTYYFDEKSMRRYYDKIGYDIVAVLQVPRLNNLTLLPSVLKNFIFHLRQRKRLNASPETGEKVWFAETRPTLFDIFTVVARKRQS